MKRIVLPFFVSVLAIPAWGAAQTPVPMTLEEALSRASAHSARLKQLRAFRAGARSGVEEAEAGRFPSLDFSAGYTRLSGVPEFATTLPDGSRAVVFPNVPDSFTARIAATWPLFSGFRVSSQVAAARERAEAAASLLAAGESDLRLETAAAWWNLVTARESERVLREGLASFDAHLRDARNRREFGMAAQNEVLAVEVERNQAELSRLQAASASEAAHADLARLVGPEPPGPIEPAGAGLPPSRPTEGLEALVAEALARRPDRRAIAQRLAAARQAVVAQKSAWWPQLHATGGYEQARPNRRVLPLRSRWEASWEVGVRLTANLFSGGATRSSVHRANAEAEAVRQELADFDRRVRLEVTERLLELGTSLARLEVAGQNLKAAAENRRVARERYRAGVAPSSELLDAENHLLRAGLQQIETLARANLAGAGLERALGR